MIREAGFFLLLCGSSCAYAHCDLSGFDQTEPRAIKGDVDDQFARFEWASDVDVHSGRSWMLSYVFNKHQSKGWSGFWDKANITIPVSRPIPAGFPFCRHVFLGRHRDEPDRDAPIIYGTNSQVQPAAVFVAKNDIAADFHVGIETAFFDEESGKIHQLHLTVGLMKKGADLFQLTISHDLPGMIVGISDLHRTLPLNQFERLLVELRKKNVRIEIASAGEFLDSGLASELFPSDPAKVNKEFLFFSNQVSELLKVQAAAEPLQVVTADIVALDSRKRPVLASRVHLPLLW